MFALRTAAAALVRSARAPAAVRGLCTFGAPLRPTVLGAAPQGLSMPVTATSTVTGVADALAPRISASPVLRALQVRNGPRDTFNPSHRIRKRRSGFLSRSKTRTGRSTLKRRQLKGRKTLSH